MVYMDYTWDLDPNRILFDEELNIDALGWKAGDTFRITNVNGRAMLVKIEPIESFVREGKRWLVKEEQCIAKSV
jgi:hypothetical protein